MTPFLLLFVALATASPMRSIYRAHHELDADGDGLVSLQEATQGIHMNQALHALDSDGDQMFTEAQALQFLDHHFFAQFDANHDHMLSFDELSGLTVGQMFDFYDHNDDGFLEGAEAQRLQYIWDAIHGHGNNRRQAADIDADGDGLISRPEVHAVMTLQNALDALDTDNDHGFTEQETTDFFGDASLYQQWNTNGDDHLRFGEVHHGITLDGVFDWFDTNGDGFLEGPEADKIVFVYNAMVAAGIHHGNNFRNHHELDANGDGQVSLQEATQAINVDQALHAMDSDGDGMFTEAQALQFLDHHFFAQFDTNHDHMLSIDELRGLTVGDMFRFYDHNHDHGFTEQETTDFFGDASLYQQWNTNGDDHLRFGEVHHGITLDGVFDWFDTNGDGFLEGPEADKIVFVYNAMVAAGIHHGNNFRNHHELDANGDGQVSLQEATQAINVDQALHAMDSDGDGMFTEAQALQFLDHHFFAQFDTNHDHMLSIDELRGLTVGDMFRFYDHNHDGFLVGTEADQFYYMWNAVHGHGNNFRNHHELDANADGQVSLTEVTQAMNIDQVIVVLDTDGDMMFTEAEALMFMSHSTFAHLDTDHDHSLTFDEIRLGLTLGQMFNFLDTDGDGFLMGAEADQFQTIWNAIQPEPPRPVLDANNDAHLSKPEVLAAMTLDEILVALDTNGDQQFTVDDALQFLDHHYINVLDTNHDHVLSFDEIRAGMTLGDLFDFYDENGDGFLYGSEADKITYMFNEVQNGGTVPIPV